MNRFPCILLLALLIAAVPGRAKSKHPEHHQDTRCYDYPADYYSRSGGAASGGYQTYEHESGSNSSTVRVRAKIAGKAYSQSSSATETSPETSIEPKKSPQPSAEPDKIPKHSTEPKTSPKHSTEPKKSPEPSVEVHKSPEPSAVPKQTPEPSAVPQKSPEPSTEPKKSPEPSAVPKQTPEPSAVPQKSPEPSTEPKKSPEPSAVPKQTPEPSAVPQKSPEPSAVPQKSLAPSPNTKTSPFPIDFSTTASSLRTRVFQGDVEGAANVLQSSRVISLAAGMTYPYELKHLVQPSENRNADPDVTALKAMAMSALQTSDAKKLADVAVLSFQSDCQCSVLTPEEADDYREHFAAIFADRNHMFEIVTADANKDLMTHRRKLQSGVGKSPVTSLVCASCWPIKICEVCFWCGKGQGRKVERKRRGRRL